MGQMYMDVTSDKKNLETMLKRVHELPEEFAAPILKSYYECKKEGLSLSRTYAYIRDLYVFSKVINKPLDIATEKDVFKIMEYIDLGDYAESTKSLYLLSLRKYFKYDWIRPTVRRYKKKLPEDLITEDEAMRIIDAASSPRDKAMLATLYDIGCRPSELMRLCLHNVSFDEYGVVLNLNGKTGSRRVRGIFCSSYLRIWIDSHPEKDTPSAPLWVPRVKTKRAYVGLTGLYKVLSAAVKKAGVQKRVYPYLFRHSRATHNASFMTEAQLCAYHGWRQGSSMPGIYVHLSGRDVDKTLLEHYGLKIDEEKKSEAVNRCPRCNEINAPGVKYCYKCGMPISREVFVRMQEAVEKTDRVLQELMNDEEFREMVLRKIGSKQV